VAEQVNWELDVLNNPEAYREWLQTQAHRGIEHLRQDGALMSLMGGPTATSHLQLHLDSGCVFHLLTNFRGLLVAMNLATEATQELADELDILHGSLEDWILTQEWQNLMSVEVPLAYLGLPNRHAAETDAGVECDDLDSFAQSTGDDDNLATAGNTGEASLELPDSRFPNYELPHIEPPNYWMGPDEVDGGCNEEKWSELIRWQKAVINALNITGSAPVSFGSPTVTRTEVFLMNCDLAEAKTPEDVIKAFDWKFERLRECR
jgi:hypothetical protein